jgi:hypothetical protein
MKKLLTCLSLLTCLTLSSCADRTRTNCERTKNKAGTATASLMQQGGGRCG